MPSRPEPQEAPEEVERFLREVLAAQGIEFSAYRLPVLPRRLDACLRVLGVASIAEARKRLRNDPKLQETAVNALLLGVTEFYRDRGVFSYLEQQVWPELFARWPQVRVWSAACSDGRELYSVGLQLAEAGWLPRAELWGTDCRASAIRQARVGQFRTEGWGDAAPFWKQVVSVGGGSVQVEDRVRSAMHWRLSNVLAETLPGPWDVILWRNLAIYLTLAAGDEVWGRLVAALRPGGYLVVGRADRPPRRLGLTRVSGCIYRKPEDRS